MSRPIPPSEVTFHQSIDPNGKLFWWNGQPYRAVRSHHASFAKRLFAAGMISQWVADGLVVPTWQTDWVLPGYPLVLQHAKISFSARSEEWSAPMFRDAALALLDFEATLEAQGLMLQDGHTGNVLFDGSRPVFVDFCSIIPNIPTPIWEAEYEFRRNFLYPLRLMSAGQTHAMRWMMPYNTNGLSSDARPATPSRSKRVKAAVRSLIPSRAYDWLKHEQRVVERYWAARRFDGAPSRARRLADLRAQIEGLTFPEPEGVAQPVGLPGERQPELRALLERLQPATVLALGDANAAHAAAFAGFPTALFALDEADSERYYRIARTEQLPLLAVRPLSRDPYDPWSWREPRADRDVRYRADLVLATNVPSPPAPDEQRRLLEPMRRLTTRWILLGSGWDAELVSRLWAWIEPSGAGLLCAASPP